MKFLKTKLFLFVSLFLFSSFTLVAQEGDTRYFSKHKVYSVKNLERATLCISDTNFIPFTQIDTIGSTLTLNVNLDSLRIVRPGKLSFIHFLLKNQESCVIPVKIWIRTINKVDKNVIDHTQYIELYAAFLNAENNHVSFQEPIELTNNIYQIVVKFYAHISRN